MKRIILMFFTVVLVLGFVSCKGKKPEQKTILKQTEVITYGYAVQNSKRKAELAAKANLKTLVAFQVKGRNFTYTKIGSRITITAVTKNAITTGLLPAKKQVQQLSDGSWEALLKYKGTLEVEASGIRRPIVVKLSDEFDDISKGIEKLFIRAIEMAIATKDSDKIKNASGIIFVSELSVNKKNGKFDIGATFTLSFD